MSWKGRDDRRERQKLRLGVFTAADEGKVFKRPKTAIRGSNNRKGRAKRVKEARRQAKVDASRRRLWKRDHS